MVAPSKIDNPSPGAEGPTILVVEDEVLVRMMIADELRSSGFRVIETANADEALAVLRSATSVDVVLTDIRMPGSMDGLALAELARSTWPRLKVVVASGQSEWRFHIAADDFFLKPYHPERVVQRIRHLLTDRQA